MLRPFLGLLGISVDICDSVVIFVVIQTHLEYLSVDPFGATSRLLYPSIEVNGQHVLWTGFLPRVSMPQPIIRLLHLQKGQTGKDQNDSHIQHVGRAGVQIE